MLLRLLNCSKVVFQVLPFMVITCFHGNSDGQLLMPICCCALANELFEQ